MNEAHRLVCAPVCCACTMIIQLCACGVEWGARRPCDTQASLRIAEVMATPTSGRAGEQWVEIANVGDAPASTDGVVLDVITDTRVVKHAVREGRELHAREHGVLARSRAMLATPAGMLTTLHLPRRAAHLRLRCEDVVYDAIAYGGTSGVAPVRGHALVRLHDGWCIAHGPAYDGANVGTPGQINDDCEQCEDQGVWRAAHPPGAGDVVITEMASDGARHTWIEVYTTSSVPVDLHALGLTVQTARHTARTYHQHTRACLPTEAGTYSKIALSRPEDATAEALVGPSLPRGTVQLSLTVQDHPVAVSTLGPLGERGGWSLAPQCVAAVAQAGQAFPAAYCRHDGRCVPTPGAPNAPCAASCPAVYP